MNEEMLESIFEAILNISKGQNTELKVQKLLLDRTKKISEDLEEIKSALSVLTGKHYDI